MISLYIKEQQNYTYNQLKKLFKVDDKRFLVIIDELINKKLLKIKNNSKENLTFNILYMSVNNFDNNKVLLNDYIFCFYFVGLIIIDNFILKCYPKYIVCNEPITELKKIFKVLKKYKSKQQYLDKFSETDALIYSNIIDLMLFFIDDYLENDLYMNPLEIIEDNGLGEINWDKTINQKFSIVKNNKPYYIELKTFRRVNDTNNFFRKLHSCIISSCSRVLKRLDLLDIFDIEEIILTDDEISDIGDEEYLLYKLDLEINIQYNTRKLLLLNSMKSFILNNNKSLENSNFSLFGTNNFNIIWEKVCSDVIGNQLKQPLSLLKLPTSLSSKYDKEQNLQSLIEKPLWELFNNNIMSNIYSSHTLIPDIVYLTNSLHEFILLIIDAKYYCIEVDFERLHIEGQPSVKDITKQYLYQLAFKEFLIEHNISKVKNIFLLPSQNNKVNKRGKVGMNILNNIGLEKIEIFELPANHVYDLYLNNKKIKIDYFL